jgi:hypothetical protein
MAADLVNNNKQDLNMILVSAIITICFFWIMSLQIQKRLLLDPKSAHWATVAEPGFS